jgi:hypothetical protein
VALECHDKYSLVNKLYLLSFATNVLEYIPSKDIFCCDIPYIIPSFKILQFTIQTFFDGLQGRCLALIQAASDGQEQGGVHDSDHFLHAIRDLLKIYSSRDSHIEVL